MLTNFTGHHAIGITFKKRGPQVEGLQTLSVWEPSTWGPLFKAKPDNPCKLKLLRQVHRLIFIQLSEIRIFQIFNKPDRLPR
jgi:hypothetical protein